MNCELELVDFRRLFVSPDGKRCRGDPVGDAYRTLMGLLAGRAPRKGPIRCIMCSRRNAMDFMGLGGGCYLVSATVNELFKSHKLKGWSSVPVSVDGFRVGSWFAPKLGRHSVPEDESRLVRDADGIVTSQDGLRFNVADWDGSDFFRVGRGLFVIVTPKVIDVLTKAKIKGWDSKGVLDIRF